MNTKQKPQRRSISYAASPEEMNMLEQIKTFHKRKTYTDAIRLLIMNEAEKILSQNCTIAQTS